MGVLNPCSLLCETLRERSRAEDTSQNSLLPSASCPLPFPIILAKTLASSRNEDLVALLLEVTNTLDVPIDGVVSDGQQSIRKAVGLALPSIAHGLCHYHYLKEAIKPIYEADRHAKKELKKKVRGLRDIERSLTNEDKDLVTIIEDYCSAVRSSITNDGHPPLEASGLNLQENLTLIEQSD
ncbi:MAG: hypothetical protein V7L23_25070 [Nostoc sp.]|uniref:hypothetical protein n=1 Tax=Nostoc sp. TaxID=1180 RepID=UPI002FF348A2